MLTKVCLWASIVGALNWGLVGAFEFNAVALLFGASIFARLIYIAIGLAALWLALTELKIVPQK